MSFRQSWSKTFYADEFKDPIGAPLHPLPHICNDDHVDPTTGRVYCLEAEYSAPNLITTGLWKLRSPIQILQAMPGVNHKVIGISTKGMHKGSKGIGGVTNATIRLYGDGPEIWRSSTLSHPHNTWTDNVFTPQKPIALFSELDVGLDQDAQANIPSTFLSMHDAQIKIDIEYYTDIPPVKVPVTINVFNQDTGEIIKEARVTIKSGPRVVADGYIDSNGTVTFQNIDVGSYTLRVIASGYNMLNQTIQVMEPAVEYDAFLVPIPAEPLAWWIIPAVVGGIGLGGLVLLKGPPKMPRMPHITVVR